MGGNLFKTPRIPKEQYFALVQTLTPVFVEAFGHHFKIPASYRNKADYGDMDVLVNTDQLTNKDWRKDLIQRLALTQYKSQTRLFSTVYDNFQVDYFALNSDDFESTYNFMSYNILGNLLGRIFHKFGLKYGERGLTYPLRNYHGNVCDEIIITKDMRRILAFLELDYQIWLNGFDNLETLFSYVIDCKYFSTLSHRKENVNNNQRKKQRKDYQIFLSYIDEHNIDKEYPFSKDKTEYIAYIDTAFPEITLADSVATHNSREALNQQVHNRFNGHTIIKLLPTIKDYQIGPFINQFKNNFADFAHFILNNDEAIVAKAIVDFYQDKFIKESTNNRD